MNTKILQKCVDALNSETPDISYIKGMLETLIEIQGVVLAPNTQINAKPKENHVGLVDEVKDEEAILAARYAGGPIGRITS